MSSSLTQWAEQRIRELDGDRSDRAMVEQIDLQGALMRLKRTRNERARGFSLRRIEGWKERPNETWQARQEEPGMLRYYRRLAR